MDRNLALEFVRVTEAAAIASSKFFGAGDKTKADQAAVDAMRSRFKNIDFDGVVVVGEGEKDKAPYLFTGEKLGNGKGPRMDIALDPLECTTHVAQGKLNSMTVLCAAPQGDLLKVPGTYMDKIAVGPKAKGVIDITRSVADNVKAVAKALDKDPDQVSVCVINRPRNGELVKQIREVGAKVIFIEHGDVAGSLGTATDLPYIDMMMGIGGAPEGIITAAALQALGGDMQAILKPHDDHTKEKADEWGLTDKVLKIDDLAVGTRCLFAATGVSDGPMLRGVRWQGDTAITHSAVMRSRSCTLRYIEAHHANER